MKEAIRLGLGCAIVMIGATNAGAAIIGTTGQVVEIAAPASVVPGALESNHQIRAFDELQQFVLPVDVIVNITSPGRYDEPGDLTPGVIATGTDVDSYLLHADKLGLGGNKLLTGSVTFDEAILGVIVLGSALRSSDAVLGAPGTTYPGSMWNPFRGLELRRCQDFVIVEPDLRTIQVHFRVGWAVDQIRVITAAPEPAAPEPGALVLLLAGSMLGLRRRRSQR